ncbi:MAG: ECF transporter S component [Clostridia bacterium]|nr:ECF transporter S component [Clostridia bacterium]
MQNNLTRVQKLITSALFLAIAYVLPFVTGGIPVIGRMLCPMHIPVLLCGFVCGAGYGMTVGFLAPLLRSLTLQMPTLFPSAVCMAAELAVYGLVAGLMYKILPKKNIFIYVSLLIAMLAGRLMWGLCMLLLSGITPKVNISLSMFFTTEFVTAMPGIIVQIAVIPVVVMILQKTKHGVE